MTTPGGKFLHEVVAPRLKRQEVQKFYHEGPARQLPKLTPGQRVTIQDLE